MFKSKNVPVDFRRDGRGDRLERSDYIYMYISVTVYGAFPKA